MSSLRQPPPSGPKSFSIEALSSLTGLGRTTLYAEIKSGRLIARKVGRRTIVLAQDAESWMAGLPQLTTRASPRGCGPLRRPGLAKKVAG